MNVDSASTAWVLMSTTLTWIAIPGIGLFYSGSTKRKSALSLLWLSLMATSVISLQWFLIGYSLTFSLSGSRFIGNLAHIATINVLNEPALGIAKIPAIVFYIFQLMFAITSATIVTGAVCERGRMWPTIVFLFIWSTLVYNVVSYWIWSPNGWANVLGALDHAGGVPVHMTAGAAALGYSLLLGKRQSMDVDQPYRPHNLNNIFIGTVLSWFGWFGFNSGNGLTISSRTALVCVVTHLAACAGGLTWCLLDYLLLKPKYKFSAFAFCMGSMTGLVCITPASGYVNVPVSILFGTFGTTFVYFGRHLTKLFSIDDPFDIFAQHGVGGFVGCILTGIFAQKYIPALDNVQITGGWLDGHGIQILYQLALASAGFIWSLIMTLIILFVMNKIPGLRLRISIDGERNGIDCDQFNEYTNDYIELQSHLSVVLPKIQVTNSCASVTTFDTGNHVENSCY